MAARRSQQWPDPQLQPLLPKGAVPTDAKRLTTVAPAALSLAFTALNIAFHAPLPFVYRLFGFGFLPFGIAAEVVLVLLDWCMCSGPRANLRTLEANGFTLRGVLGAMLWNAVFFQVFSCLLSMYCAGTEDRWSLGLLVRVLACLALVEVGFTWTHRGLHQHPWLAPFHVMHHCCLEPSFSSNFVLHPFDFVLEFGMPAIISALICLGLFRDRWALLVTFTVLQLWYNVDHDPNLRLHHYAHHSFVDSNYSVYVNTRDRKPQLLTSMIKRAAREDAR